MKHRFSSHTTLIELAAAMMCFLLVSLTVLGLFTRAYTLSGEGRARRQAAVLAQDCAELIAGSEDVTAALQGAGYAPAEGGMTRQADAGMNVFVALDEEQTEVGSLLRAQIRVTQEDVQLIELPAARYYNKEVIHP